MIHPALARLIEIIALAPLPEDALREAPDEANISPYERKACQRQAGPRAPDARPA
jgi:hypothetical protein